MRKQWCSARDDGALISKHTNFVSPVDVAFEFPRSEFSRVWGLENLSSSWLKSGIVACTTVSVRMVAILSTAVDLADENLTVDLLV